MNYTVSLKIVHNRDRRSRRILYRREEKENIRGREEISEMGRREGLGTKC